MTAATPSTDQATCLQLLRQAYIAQATQNERTEELRAVTHEAQRRLGENTSTTQLHLQEAQIWLERTAQSTAPEQILQATQQAERTLQLTLVGLALIVGFAFDHIANPSGTINLIALPLLGLLLWNLVVYGVIALGVVLNFFQHPLKWSWFSALVPMKRLLKAQPAWLRHGLQGLIRWATPSGTVPPGFWPLWLQARQAKTQALLIQTLHIAAAALALGMMLSLWTQGLTTEFTVGWESTWLSATQVQTIVQTLYGWLPTDFLWGVAPWPADFQSLNLKLAHSLTTLTQTQALLCRMLWLLALVIVCPRLLLAWSIRRQRVPYVLPTLHAPAAPQADPTTHPWTILYNANVPLSFQSALQAWHRQTTPPATLCIESEINLHWQVEPLRTLPSKAYFLIWNGSETPELEIHGEQLQALLKRAFDVVVWIDMRRFVERFDPQSTRYQERVHSWKMFMSAYHVRLHFLNE